MYKRLFTFFRKYFRDDQVFKFGFNISPMYRRSVGKIKHVSKDLMLVKIEIPLNWKNRNYAGSIFGGSMFAATDPICMIQLIQILGNDFVVWDKAASIDYKKPARSRAYATFEFTTADIALIKSKIATDGRYDITKHIDITNKEGVVFAKVEKLIYVASKEYHKAKREAERNV